ncbi:hypothetical protein [Sporomusa paucivorans]|uniref:hypothetical protein n=2 Tax=Sporomusa TaxID=2375 RepID=UPI00315B6D86
MMKAYCLLFFSIAISALLLIPQSVRANDFTLTGLIDARFNVKQADGHKIPSGSTYRNGFSYNLELYPQIKLQNNWTVTAVIAHAKNATGKIEDPFDLYRVAVNGQIKMTDVTVGSFKYWPMNGLLHGDARLDGIKLIFGHKLRTTAVIAKDRGWRHSNQHYRAFHFTTELSSGINLRGGFFTQNQTVGTKKLGAVGLDLPCNDLLTLTVDYAFTPASGPGNKSYIAGFNYRGGKTPLAKKGQAGAWLHWLQATPNATINADTDIPDMDGWHNNNGNRGIAAGVAYMLADNIKWSAKYMNYTDIVSDQKSQVYRTQVELFF